jgi:hypothetical protein
MADTPMTPTAPAPFRAIVEFFSPTALCMMVAIAEGTAIPDSAYHRRSFRLWLLQVLAPHLNEAALGHYMHHFGRAFPTFSSSINLELVEVLQGWTAQLQWIEDERIEAATELAQAGGDIIPITFTLMSCEQQREVRRFRIPLQM